MKKDTLSQTVDVGEIMSTTYTLQQLATRMHESYNFYLLGYTGFENSRSMAELHRKEMSHQLKKLQEQLDSLGMMESLN